MNDLITNSTVIYSDLIKNYSYFGTLFTRRRRRRGGSPHALQIAQELHAHVRDPAKADGTYHEGGARDAADGDPVFPGEAGGEGAVEGHEDAHGHAH
jgi:hypothetical protein